MKPDHRKEMKADLPKDLKMDLQKEKGRESPKDISYGLLKTNVSTVFPISIWTATLPELSEEKVILDQLSCLYSVISLKS